MKIVNKVKLREEVDYESLCRRLENQVDQLTAEVERLEKLRATEKYHFENKLKACQESLVEMKSSLSTRSEVVGFCLLTLALWAENIFTHSVHVAMIWLKFISFSF